MTNWDLLPVDEGHHERRPPPLNDIVPADIWATIFQVAYEGQHKVCQELLLVPQTSYFVPRKALLLSQVCRHWRAIATSQPLLWRNIYVCMQHKSPYDLLRTYIERTGDADLFISIVAYSSDIDDVHELQLQSCFQLLHSVSHRWKSVSFTLGETARAEFEKLFCGDGDVKRPDFSSLETVSAWLANGREHMQQNSYAFIDDFCDTVKITPACLRIGGWFTSRFDPPTPKYVHTKPGDDVSIETPRAQ
ncbi:hypothetical protein BJ165DRAFT_565905 [Panaeolus papilionaceus]|nr:hypothetical protein BJ165DRAFT_565905 [Panaeolus papilionaceus]